MYSHAKADKKCDTVLHHSKYSGYRGYSFGAEIRLCSDLYVFSPSDYCLWNISYRRGFYKIRITMIACCLCRWNYPDYLQCKIWSYPVFPDKYEIYPMIWNPIGRYQSCLTYLDGGIISFVGRKNAWCIYEVACCYHNRHLTFHHLCSWSGLFLKIYKDCHRSSDAYGWHELKFLYFLIVEYEKCMSYDNVFHCVSSDDVQ